MNTKKPFETAVVGGIEVKNRIFRSATGEAFATEGKTNQVIYDMYEKLCQGKIGLISMGYFSFSKTDHKSGNVLQFNTDAVTSLKNLTDMVHQYDTKIIAQLNHASTQLFVPPEGHAYGPSGYIDPASTIPSTPFSTEQIHNLIKEFGEAASLAKSSGFDGVQLHAAHGYLLSKFLSPTFNKRTDEYGGDTQKNMQIVVDILNEIKTICGNDYPVWIKLNSSDFELEGKGLTEDLFLETAEALSEKGIDAIEVSGGTLSGFHVFSRSIKHVAYHLESAKKLTDKLKASVILVGGIREIDTIDAILSETKIDAVSLSRSLIREPNLVKRWMDGDRSKAKCVACNGCFNFSGVRCFFDLTKAEQEEQRPMMKMMQSKN